MAGLALIPPLGSYNEAMHLFAKASFLGVAQAITAQFGLEHRFVAPEIGTQHLDGHVVLVVSDAFHIERGRSAWHIKQGGDFGRQVDRSN